MSIKSQQTKYKKYDFNSILLHDNARDQTTLAFQMIFIIFILKIL